jgi:hypothetical protein
MKSVIYAAGVVALTGFIALTGFSNPSTDAGSVGYCVQKAVFGHARFYSLQTGPTSTGMGWQLGCTNVSVTPYTYDMTFNVKDNYVGANAKKVGLGGDRAVVAHDKLKMQFTLHVNWQVDSAGVKEYVENYAVIRGTDPDSIALDTFMNFLASPLQTFARQEIEKWEGLATPDHMGDMGQALTERLRVYAKGTPFKINQITIGAIQPPTALMDNIAQVQTMTQQLDQLDQQIKWKREEKSARIEEAHGIKKGMDELNAGLTDEYLQWEAIKVRRASKDGKNHKTIYIYEGLGVTGTVPLGQSK